MNEDKIKDVGYGHNVVQKSMCALFLDVLIRIAISFFFHKMIC